MKLWVVPVLLMLASGQACNKRPVPPPVASKGLPHVDPQPETLIIFTAGAASIPAPETPDFTIAAPLPPPPVAPALTAINEAGRAFAAADYPSAISRYEEYLKLATAGDRRDEALFRLGVIYALSTPQRDWSRAMGHFKELITHHPNSPLQPIAQLFTALRTEILALSADRDKQAERVRQLEAAMERFKQIDADRLKRTVP